MNIICRDLKKEYGSNCVLNVEHLELRSGDLVGIIGSNGAGKTTLLNILAGLDESFSGEVEYFKDFDPLLDVSMVFQQPYMLARTVYKNLEYPLKTRKFPKEKREVLIEAMLKRLELEHLSARRATSLSGGEKQRLAMARGIIGKPKLLLLDEPTSGTDFYSTGIIEELMRENQRDGITQIIVTHNLAQAKRICKTLVFLNKGKLVEMGETEALLSNPKTEFFKQFIESQTV